jgi:hypothetical protein
MHEAIPTTALAITPTVETTHLYVAQFLARYAGQTRVTYSHRLRLFIVWCAELGLDPITGVSWAHLELYAGGSRRAVATAPRRCTPAPRLC